MRPISIASTPTFMRDANRLACHVGHSAARMNVGVDAIEIGRSETLSDVQKRRVVNRLGPTLRAVAQDERSQARNRQLALERLVAQLREALRVPRKRRPTKPSQAAVERRLDEKRRRSQLKRLRTSRDD